MLYQSMKCVVSILRDGNYVQWTIIVARPVAVPYVWVTGIRCVPDHQLTNERLDMKRETHFQKYRESIDFKRNTQNLYNPRFWEIITRVTKSLWGRPEVLLGNNFLLGKNFFLGNNSARAQTFRNRSNILPKITHILVNMLIKISTNFEKFGLLCNYYPRRNSIFWIWSLRKKHQEQLSV